MAHVPTQDIISYVRTLETSFSEQEWVWIIKVINALFQIRTWNSYLLAISAKINQKSIWKLFEFFEFVM